ncbi:MAG: LPS export ABC transporter permease LptG [Rubrimonas sp.]|uniref:LPS export ABC transporter permease LptG n=1 Tax=Rubrimonas sp. TaxID=2036015 RepID=UPI002FDED1F2
MSWTLSRYIGGRFLGLVLSAFAVVFALIVMINAIELLRRSSGAEIGFGAILGMAALQAPAIALTASPFVTLLASLACFARLARSSELVVTRAAGVSAWALVAAPLALAVGLGALSTVALNPLAAFSAERFATLEARWFSGRESPLSVSREGLWLRDGGPQGQVVIHARAANPQATRLDGVTFHLFGREDVLTGRIDAESAELGDGAWALRRGVRHVIDPDAEGLDVVRAEPFEEMRAPTELTSAQILDSFAPPEQVSVWALPAFIRTLEASGFSAQRHRTQWHGQLAAPLLFAAMALIGAAFSMRHARLGGLGGMALAAAVTGLGFYFLSDLAKALAASGAIPAVLGAWGPPAAAALFAAALVLHLEDG